MSQRTVHVYRCPKCGSTDAGPDQEKSEYAAPELTYFGCNACGEGGFIDSWERDFDWTVSTQIEGDEEIPKFLPPLAPGAGLYDPKPDERP